VYYRGGVPPPPGETLAFKGERLSGGWGGSIFKIWRPTLLIDSQFVPDMPPHPPDRRSPLKASVSPGGGGTPPPVIRSLSNFLKKLFLFPDNLFVFLDNFFCSWTTFVLTEGHHVVKLSVPCCPLGPPPPPSPACNVVCYLGSFVAWGVPQHLCLLGWMAGALGSKTCGVLRQWGLNSRSTAHVGC